MFLVVYIVENIKSTPSSPPGRKHTNTNKTNIKGNIPNYYDINNDWQR